MHSRHRPGVGAPLVLLGFPHRSGMVGVLAASVRRGHLHGCRVLLLSVVLAVTTSWGSVVIEALSAGKVQTYISSSSSVSLLM